MKRYFIFFIWFTAANLFSAIALGQKASMEIRLVDGRYPDKYMMLEFIHIEKNNKVFYETKTYKKYGWDEKREHKRKLKLKNLDTGIYEISYPTYFNSSATIKVHISDFKRHQITLNKNFVDTVNKDYYSVIDSLKNNENYYIVLGLSSCFMFGWDTMFIHKGNNIYTATFKSEKKILSPADIKIIHQFELELSQVANGGSSTTTYTYIVGYKEMLKKVEYSNFGNHWNGYRHLQKQLFNIHW